MCVVVWLKVGGVFFCFDLYQFNMFSVMWWFDRYGFDQFGIGV